MTEAQELATFVDRARVQDLSAAAMEQLKIRVLNTIGVAIAALAAPTIIVIRDLTAELGGRPVSTLIGGGKTAPDRAAFFNGALSRYLDFMDSYIAFGETCHPSDNLGALLAAAEMHDASEAHFLTALAVAYQVQTRLSDVAPVRHRGFDHTVQGAYAASSPRRDWAPTTHLVFWDSIFCAATIARSRSFVAGAFGSFAVPIVRRIHPHLAPSP